MSKKTNKLLPEIRFPEFVNDAEWEVKTLGDCVDYLQPTKFLVSSTAYNNNYKTPVLTAGKTFILGYTNEVDDIFNKKLPVIIFDDFTTASKYVDFPFKAKSSAMKILLSKNDVNIKFTYELMQMIGYKVGVHERHWISIFSNLTVPIPENPNEQQKIASCLSSLDETIAAHSQKLDTLKNHKKGLMQNLFPQDGENVPKFRFKEFVNDGDWVENKLENYINLFSGIALKSEELSDDKSGIPILRGINITEGCIRHSKEIDKYFVGNLENLKKYLIRENDIVIGMDGSKVGKNVALIKKEDENSILIQRVARIRTNEKSDIKYVYHHFLSDKFRGYVDTVNTSSGIPHISAQQIKDFQIGFPPKLKEQKKVADCLTYLDDLITGQTQIIEQLKLQKKGLMQGLFPKIIE
jgi:type I restriction enzyme, S subunit